MTRNMLRRVEAVNRTSERIIHGDLAQRVPVSGSGDEFDQLAANLNAMLDQIERLMSGMRQVTDNVAHDLRTPLARLRARLEVTLLEKPDAQLYADALRDTITEADRLLGTFNALLSIAEAEAGSRRDAWSIVDLAEIARTVAELYEPVADESGLRLLIETDDSLPVRGDRHLLSQALANLLDNALKYSPAGKIMLRAHRQRRCHPHRGRRRRARHSRRPARGGVRPFRAPGREPQHAGQRIGAEPCARGGAPPWRRVLAGGQRPRP